jgi:hypothetical protein
MSQVGQEQGRDKYDALCNCVLIDTTPSDQLRSPRNDAHRQDILRSLVNAGLRDIIPLADCRVCGGGGEKPVEAHP